LTVNACIMDEKYNPNYLPIVINLIDDGDDDNIELN
jgi:hypothetical protein